MLPSTRAPTRPPLQTPCSAPPHTHTQVLVIDPPVSLLPGENVSALEGGSPLPQAGKRHVLIMFFRCRYLGDLLIRGGPSLWY